MQMLHRILLFKRCEGAYFMDFPAAALGFGDGSQLPIFCIACFISSGLTSRICVATDQ